MLVECYDIFIQLSLVLSKLFQTHTRVLLKAFISSKKKEFTKGVDTGIYKNEHQHTCGKIFTGCGMRKNSEEILKKVLWFYSDSKVALGVL